MLRPFTFCLLILFFSNIEFVTSQVSKPFPACNVKSLKFRNATVNIPILTPSTVSYYVPDPNNTAEIRCIGNGTHYRVQLNQFESYAQSPVTLLCNMGSWVLLGQLERIIESFDCTTKEANVICP